MGTAVDQNFAARLRRSTLERGGGNSADSIVADDDVDEEETAVVVGTGSDEDEEAGKVGSTVAALKGPVVSKERRALLLILLSVGEEARNAFVSSPKNATANAANTANMYFMANINHREQRRKRGGAEFSQQRQ